MSAPLIVLIAVWGGWGGCGLAAGILAACRQRYRPNVVDVLVLPLLLALYVLSGPFGFIAPKEEA